LDRVLRASVEESGSKVTLGTGLADLEFSEAALFCDELELLRLLAERLADFFIFKFKN
jgi:hypothetical protein